MKTIKYNGKKVKLLREDLYVHDRFNPFDIAESVEECGKYTKYIINKNVFFELKEQHPKRFHDFVEYRIPVD